MDSSLSLSVAVLTSPELPNAPDEPEEPPEDPVEPLVDTEGTESRWDDPPLAELTDPGLATDAMEVRLAATISFGPPEVAS